MEKRSIRYKKPEWKNWVWETVDEKDLESRVSILKGMGYIVEA